MNRLTSNMQSKRFHFKTTKVTLLSVLRKLKWWSVGLEFYSHLMNGQVSNWSESLPADGRCHVGHRQGLSTKQEFISHSPVLAAITDNCCLVTEVSPPPFNCVFLVELNELSRAILQQLMWLKVRLQFTFTSCLAAVNFTDVNFLLKLHSFLI